MAIYIRRIGEIPDGSITEQKLADLAVSTQKLKDQAVSLAKAQQALKIHHFTGDETEESVIGTSETDIKLFKIVKSSANTKGMQPQRVHLNAEVKVTGASGAQGTLKLYVDDEVSPRITVNTTSDIYEMQEGDADFSDLANGSHDIRITGVTDNAGATVYNDLIEVFIEK